MFLEHILSLFSRENKHSRIVVTGKRRQYFISPNINSHIEGIFLAGLFPKAKRCT